MIRKPLLFIVLSLVVLCAQAQNLGFSITDGATKVRIPIEIYDNLIVVPIVLNGRLPLRFILDTGVRTTILTSKAFSDFLHLSYSKKYTISGPGGEKLIDAFVATNVTIDLPGIHGDGHSILVLDKDYLELRNYLGVDVHGILGYELFSRFVVDIDYQNKYLTLMAPNRLKSMRRYQALDIHIEDTKPYLFTRVTMNDSTEVRAKLLVDTGASHGLLLDPQSDPRIMIPAKHINNIIGRGLGGVITGEIGRIKGIQLGKYSLPDIIAHFPDANVYTDTLKDSKSVFRNGTIGGEILSRFHVVFDFPHEKMYLIKNIYLKRKFHYNLSGITVKSVGESFHEFQIMHVRPNSAAARASVQEGDTILSIGIIPAEELDMNRIEVLLNRKPGKTVEMEIGRNGRKLLIRFVLENSI